jgi:hypothetical protein
MFTALTIVMTLSGTVTVETPALSKEASRPALVQLAANATIGGGGKKEFGNAKGSNPAQPVYGKGSNGKPTGYPTIGAQQGYGNGVPSNGKPAGYPTIGAPQGYGNGPVTILPLEPNKGGPVISPPAGNGGPPPNNNGLSIDQLRQIENTKG